MQMRGNYVNTYNASQHVSHLRLKITAVDARDNKVDD